jgi:hypothetical protein
MARLARARKVILRSAVKAPGQPRPPGIKVAAVLGFICPGCLVAPGTSVRHRPISVGQTAIRIIP